MGLIRLEDDQRLNVREIDSQHETLIELINRLHKAMMGGGRRSILDGIIAELIEHTRTHFQYEEKLMLEHNYPGYARHKQEHERLIRHIVDLADGYRSGDLLLSFAVMVDLRGWALVHIQKFDLALGRFLNREQRVETRDEATSSRISTH
ncbi:MAG: bacteriohemerythrin [Gammaproteobacteria bacterium]